MKKGTFKIIRVDGSVESYTQAPTFDFLHEKLGAECLDTVTLTTDKHGVTDEVMLVDDTGMIDNKPVNDKATAIMMMLYKQQYPYSIHGDVAICNDSDFAREEV